MTKFTPEQRLARIKRMWKVYQESDLNHRIALIQYQKECETGGSLALAKDWFRLLVHYQRRDEQSKRILDRLMEVES